MDDDAAGRVGRSWAVVTTMRMHDRLRCCQGRTNDGPEADLEMAAGGKPGGD
jgi:hypothetical protein